LSFKNYFKLHHDDAYRHIFHIDDIDVCKLLNGASTTPLLKSMVEHINRRLPSYVRICTSSGWIKFNNMSFPKFAFYEAFPKGHYLSEVHYFDELDPSIMTINASYVLSK
jgi:hypothetical protein